MACARARFSSRTCNVLPMASRESPVGGFLNFGRLPALILGYPGCRVGCLEGRWKTGFWTPRRSFWMSREFILDSSKVCFEFARVMFATYNRFGALVSAFRVSSEYFFHLDSFWRQRTCFCAHETDSELQFLRCLFPKLQFLSDPACQRSSDRGPACH